MSEDLVQTMVQRIVERFRPVRVILFGSRARGEAGPWSDVDLLVVLDVAHHVAPPRNLVRRGHVVGDVLRSALREGKVVYERT